MWFNATCECQPQLPRWKEGDIVGCFIDIDKQTIIFSLNGVPLPYGLGVEFKVLMR